MRISLFRRLPDKADTLYDKLEEPAKIIKSAIQMLIGLWALFELGRQFCWSQAHPSCAPGGHHGFCYGIPQSYDVLNLTGDALAAVAAVELVYTLFTSGPDEALDPLMLGLSAAALLSLGSVSGFKVSDGITLLLYAGALAVLFITKNISRRKHCMNLRKINSPVRKQLWARRTKTGRQRTFRRRERGPRD